MKPEGSIKNHIKFILSIISNKHYRNNMQQLFFQQDMTKYTNKHQLSIHKSITDNSTSECDYRMRNKKAYKLFTLQGSQSAVIITTWFLQVMAHPHPLRTLSCAHITNSNLHMYVMKECIQINQLITKSLYLRGFYLFILHHLSIIATFHEKTDRLTRSEPHSIKPPLPPSEAGRSVEDNIIDRR